jgi:hypothetical protein
MAGMYFQKVKLWARQMFTCLLRAYDQMMSKWWVETCEYMIIMQMISAMEKGRQGGIKTPNRGT